jgi:Methyltransferase domain
MTVIRDGSSDIMDSAVMDAAVIDCRLCGGKSVKAFSHKVIAKYDVDYFQCEKCEAIQTEAPYWLDEVYTSDIQPEDVNYLSRNLGVYHFIQYFLKYLKIKADPVVLDFGGGLGLVPRLLRENGVNAFNYDTYAKSPFIDVKWDGSSPDFIVSSEVFEHLANPAVELEELFGHQPDYVYIRTWRYFNQGKDWEYFGPEHGAHVFIYTDKSMAYIAKKYGYTVELLNEVDVLFCKQPLSQFEKRVVLRGVRSRAVRGFLKLVHRPG